MGGEFDLCSSARCILIGPMFWAAAAAECRATREM